MVIGKLQPTAKSSGHGPPASSSLLVVLETGDKRGSTLQQIPEESEDSDRKAQTDRDLRCMTRNASSQTSICRIAPQVLISPMHTASPPYGCMSLPTADSTLCTQLTTKPRHKFPPRPLIRKDLESSMHLGYEVSAMF